jgi:hypothetical protein
MRQRTVVLWVWWMEALLLTAATGGLVWAVTAGDRESAKALAVLAWVAWLGVVTVRDVPETARWVLALIAVGFGASAVGFFLLFQWADWPAMAYLHAIGTGLLSLLKAVGLWGKCSHPSPGPGGAGGRGEPQPVARD